MSEPPLSRKPWNFRSFDVLQLPTISPRALMPRAIVKSVPGQSIGVRVNGPAPDTGTRLRPGAAISAHRQHILTAIAFSDVVEAFMSLSFPDVGTCHLVPLSIRAQA